MCFPDDGDRLCYRMWKNKGGFKLICSHIFACSLFLYYKTENRGCFCTCSELEKLYIKTNNLDKIIMKWDCRVHTEARTTAYSQTHASTQLSTMSKPVGVDFHFSWCSKNRMRNKLPCLLFTHSGLTTVCSGRCTVGEHWGTSSWTTWQTGSWKVAELKSCAPN